MSGYQPQKTCNSCKKCTFCNKSKNGKRACKKYEEFITSPPKTLTAPPSKSSPAKQRTVLSVRDFAILYDIANRKLADIEANIIALDIDREEALTNPYYQDLLRIREKLGELNIEVETPSVEVEE